MGCCRIACTCFFTPLSVLIEIFTMGLRPWILLVYKQRPSSVISPRTMFMIRHRSSSSSSSSVLVSRFIIHHSRIKIMKVVTLCPRIDWSRDASRSHGTSSRFARHSDSDPHFGATDQQNRHLPQLVWSCEVLASTILVASWNDLTWFNNEMLIVGTIFVS